MHNLQTTKHGTRVLSLLVIRLIDLEAHSGCFTGHVRLDDEQPDKITSALELIGPRARAQIVHQIS